jgi:PAS domain S-box-containing protein
MNGGALPEGPAQRPVRVVAGVALAYLLVGLLALQLSIPPGYAAPIYPSAGIALAAALVYGAPGLAGAALGAFLVNFSLGAPRSLSDLAGLGVPLAIGAGAALQAALAAALVRRFVTQPLKLATARDIVLFGVLGAALPCVVNATVGITALWLAGTVDGGQYVGNVLTWWTGDTLGVLIGAPVALALVGQPRSWWAPRWRTVAVPLLGATGLLALAVVAVGQWDRDRQQAAFLHDATALGAEIKAQLAQPVHALQAMHGLHLAGIALDDDSLAVAARWWLAQPGAPQAIGASVRVPRDGVAGFEARAREAGMTDFRVFDRQPSAVADPDEDRVVLRLIEPREGNLRALGVNALSIPSARAAIVQARRSGLPTASAAFALTQSARGEPGVVVYQALYGGQPSTEAQREAAFVGVVFVTLNTERSFVPAAWIADNRLDWCLVDLDPAATVKRLAGTAGCHALGARPHQTRHRVAFAGRDWELQVSAAAGVYTGVRGSNAWALAAAGLLGASLLGALLLLVTGRTLRIGEAVNQRTAELQREVAERRTAEDALRDSEARLRSIFEQVPIGVTFIDPHGRVNEGNPHLCRMLGRSADELRRMSIDQVLHADDLAETRQALQALWRGEVTQVDREIRLRRADGEVFWARAQLTVLRDGQGRPLRLAGAIEDISERLRLQQAERERDRAESANRTKNEFVSRMSHELRTPLNAMIGFAQLLGMAREPALAPPQQAWAAQIQRAGWHLLEMINDTLDLARIESGLVSLSLRPVELEPLLAHSLSMVQSAAAERSVDVGSSVQPDASTVLADDTRLTQVLTNLLSNAIKYNRPGGDVQLQVRAAPGPGAGWVELTVRDNGLGMTAEQLAGLFQPYNRLGRENSGIEGTGIGLVISRRLAELMGGTLEADSRAGVGSTFTLRLPAADTARPPDAQPPLPDDALAYQRRRVHYIEDNPTTVEVMRGILAQRPQIELSVSTLGLDGLDAVRRQRPDLILLDMQLPDVGGLELLHHLKQDDRLGDIPVVMVSADATPASIEKALTLGAVHYVTKPVAVAPFLSMIDGLLEVIDTHWG